jgi:hypothetical protein
MILVKNKFNYPILISSSLMRIFIKEFLWELKKIDWENYIFL